MFCFLVAALAGVAPAARGAIILSVDLDPSTAGIQSNVTAVNGQSITANIVMELTGSSNLSFYQFSLGFDRSELTFNSRTESAPPGFGFVETDTRNLDNLATAAPQGQLYLFGADTGAGPVAPFAPFVVATASFTVNNPSGGLGDIDLFPFKSITAPFEDDFLTNGTFVPVPNGELVFNGGSVTAIPEPSSIGLVCIGSVLASLRRRRCKTIVACN